MKVIARLMPEKDMNNVDITLSVSKLKTFDDCKAKYKFCYIDKLPRIDRDFHIFGKYLHQVLENFHNDLIQNESSKSDWPTALYKARDSALVEYDPLLTIDQKKEGNIILEQYSSILKEDGLPNVIANEKSFFINLNDKVLLNGFIDRIQIDDDGMIHVMDYKTTKNPKYLNDHFQLVTYCYALMLEDESIKRIRASFVLLRHSFDFITQEFSRDEIFPVAEKFLKYAYLIEDEKLWRPQPQFLCTYCDYLEFCGEGKKFLGPKNPSKGFNKTSNAPKTIAKPVVGMRKW